MRTFKWLVLIATIAIGTFLLGWGLSGNYKTNPYTSYTHGVVTGISEKAASGTVYFIKVDSGETLSIQSKQYNGDKNMTVGDTLDLVIVWSKSRILLQVIDVSQ